MISFLGKSLMKSRGVVGGGGGGCSLMGPYCCNKQLCPPNLANFPFDKGIYTTLRCPVNAITA